MGPPQRKLCHLPSDIFVCVGAYHDTTLPRYHNNTREDKTKQDNTSLDKGTLHNATRHKTRKEKTRQDKTTRSKTRGGQMREQAKIQKNKPEHNTTEHNATEHDTAQKTTRRMGPPLEKKRHLWRKASFPRPAKENSFNQERTRLSEHVKPRCNRGLGICVITKADVGKCGKYSHLSYYRALKIATAPAHS